MSAGGDPSAALLADIAETLGVPVEAFRDPACLNEIRRTRVDHVADLLAALMASDPHFLRIAQAFLDIQDPAGRRALTDTAVAIAGAFASPDHRAPPGFPQAPSVPESP